MEKKLKWSSWWRQWSNYQDKQILAEELVDKYDYLFFGGAAGPGKSYFLRKYPVKFLIEECFAKKGLRGVRAGLFCEDYPALHDRHISRIPYEFPDWLGTYKDKTHEFVIDEKYGGGVIAFRNLDDPSKYMSAEFALIAVDELTKNKKETFDFLRLRKRWTGINRTKFIGVSNPGGIGHQWVKDLWMDKKFDDNEKEKDQFHFLPALPSDNKYLTDGYLKVLDSMPEKLRKAYRDGNWDVFAGQYFTEWDKNRHVAVPFSIPASWKKFRAYDYGYENPAVCKWYTVDSDGRVWVYREKYWPKGHNVPVDKQAEEILRLSKVRDPITGDLVDEQYQYSVADPAIFSPTGMVDKAGAQTIAETFARCGIIFIPGSNRRMDGWALMHKYFQWDDQHPPKMMYFNTCHDSIRTIPSLIYDEHKPEDVDSDGEDHAADTDRYFIMSLHERKSERPKNEVEKKLEQMKQANSFKPSNINDFYLNQGNR